MKYKLVILALCLMTSEASLASSRAQIRRTGSSTILPFTQEVNKLFTKDTGNLTPLLTTNGSGAGIKQFCENAGGRFSPDFVDASRNMKKEELEICFKNGITDIIKLTIGYNGLCFLHSLRALEKEKISNFSLTPTQIFAAVVKNIPTKDGKLIPNPNHKWSDIDPTLPKAQIKLYIPPVSHGTRDDFNSKILEANCDTFAWIKELKTKDPTKYAEICQTLREDKEVVILKDFELTENNAVLIDNLANERLGALGVTGCNIYMLQERPRIKPIQINKIEASPKTLKDGTYPFIYSLQIYFNRARINLVQGLGEYIKTYSSRSTIGPNGLFSKFGVVPIDPSENPITAISPQNPVT